MEGIPTYSEMRAQKENADMQKQQQMKQSEVAQQGLTQKNPVLERYMGSEQGQPQGLNPDNASAYTRIATQVANSVGSQEEYAQVMFDGVTKGAVDPRDFLGDASIPDGAKQTLVSLLQGGPQNEQAPIGLNPR